MFTFKIHSWSNLTRSNLVASKLSVLKFARSSFFHSFTVGGLLNGKFLSSWIRQKPKFLMPKSIARITNDSPFKGLAADKGDGNCKDVTAFAILSHFTPETADL
ncbi:hypothetical protein WICPIJ_004789 [Wickerhamomyces pijperi]|uniref:Uncharacterized protein n=1 Tax=Wickerhamomyces pijperi TaxID=599730 RepID=A0A9P8Q591_WICPI|nr:hypothetical protein WICPIJ_004789 [Wickerhamomyces pijperi]